MKSASFIPLFFVIPLVLLTPLLSIQAQNRIDTWTTDNGLPQNSVTGLTQTPDGYIWFTTNDGLVRFDGVQFKVFNKSNTPEITTNRMKGAFADKSGRLWMQIEDGGTLFYEKGVFHVAVKPGSLPPGSRSQFFNDPAGGVIFHIHYDPHHYQHYRYQDGNFVPFKVEGLSEDSFLVLVDRGGGLWFADEKGFRLFKDGKIINYDFGEFGTADTYKTAYEDGQGGIWLGYANEQRRIQSLHRVKNGRLRSFQLPSAAVSHFAEDLSGNLLLSIYTKGIYRIGKESLAADEPVNDVLEPVASIEGISNITSGYLCADREGGMWVGTNKGLVRLTPQVINVFSTQEGLPEENVYPIYEDSGGRIWAGIWQNSLVKFEQGSFKTFLRTADTYYITSLFEDRSGRLWVGSISGLRYLDKGHLVRFTEQAGFSGYVEFSVISQDKDNNLWFGTDQGLSRYADGRATVFTKEDGLPDDYVVALWHASDGKIWVGTRGGLASIESGKIEAFTTADGLASNYIRSLYEDADRVLWIGSYDGGLTRLKDGKFTRFTKNEGLSSNGVFCILEDNRGWFWMNSNQGIYRVSRRELNDFADGKIKSLTSIAYNRQDGLLNIEGNGGRQPAGIRSRDGRLWLPTAQGIAVVDPEAVTTNQLPPPVLIEEIVVDRNRLENKKIQSVVNNQPEIMLAPDQTTLEINYTGISFINSGQVRFKYKLEGLDRDWNEVGTRRTAYYSYLPPGEYTFHVIAANRDGVWNNEGARIRVRVFPPFYRTYWFLLLCVALTGLLVWMGYRRRVRSVRARLASQFEERLRERTLIAQDLHDTLLQGFLSASMQLHVADDKLPADSPAKPLVRRVLELMGQVIEEGRNAVRGLRSANGHSSLNLEEAFSRSQQELAVKDEIAFRVVVEGRPQSIHPVIRDEVYRIGHEALINAFRHSRAKTIEVEVDYSANQLRVLVSDDGDGIDPQVLRSGRDGHWGLSGMRERAERIGARLKVRSRVASGTEVELSVPGQVAFKSEPSQRDSGRLSRLRRRRKAEDGTPQKSESERNA
ncbi:MAG TPA: two-component regulator propeller domain-containing protein [Pyrinomonadaceae bacterium]|nr:two-component regulator propeller domain-containing protein [Pyrinomonadaceae bacterium]